MDEIIIKFLGLEKQAREIVIYKLLLNGHLSYEEISKLYVKSLEKSNENKGKLLNDVAYMASHYIEIDGYKRNKDSDDFVKRKLSYSLKQTGIFKGTGFEKILDKIIK